MTVTIFLLWSLVAGDVTDVDAFTSEEQCHVARQDQLARVHNAIEQTGNEDLKKVSFPVCVPLEVRVPRHVAL